MYLKSEIHPFNASLEALTIPPPTQPQKSILITMSIMAIVIAILWNVSFLKSILYPFKLITVAFHEFGHAFVGVLTGAEIVSIELDPDLGGLTKMRGGIQYLTLPAGYLGSSLFGSAMIFCSFNLFASQIVSGIIAASLLLVLYWAKNWLARIITLTFIGIIGVGFWYRNSEYLAYFTMWMGVMSALYSTWDILEDLVLRKVNASDATQFAKLCSCCPAQIWGVIWLFISLAFMAGAIIGALYVFK